ncbi:hypothetical protein Tco_1000826 [Tanacetum coccineum]
MFRKRVLTLDKDNESVDSTKFQEHPKISHLEVVKRIFRNKSTSEESVNEGEMGESSKELKRKFETMKRYECDERNATHMMIALKEARMKSREMLLSFHHSIKMLLDIISKMNKNLEDEKIKINDKGKEKVRVVEEYKKIQSLNKEITKVKDLPTPVHCFGHNSVIQTPF